MSFIKIWGCEAFVKRLMSDKLSSRSDKCIFMGYPKETKGYYLYYKSENKIVVARHAVFLEKEFLARESSRSNVQLEEIQVTHESDVGGDFIVPSMDAEANGSRTPEPSSHGDECWVLVQPNPVKLRKDHKIKFLLLLKLGIKVCRMITERCIHFNPL
jgi:hypothetical protein